MESLIRMSRTVEPDPHLSGSVRLPGRSVEASGKNQAEEKNLAEVEVSEKNQAKVEASRRKIKPKVEASEIPHIHIILSGSVMRAGRFRLWRKIKPRSSLRRKTKPLPRRLTSASQLV